MRIAFTVPGKVTAKMRHKTVPFAQCSGCRKTGSYQKAGCRHCGGEMKFLANIGITPNETRSYENWVAMNAQEAMKELGEAKFGEFPVKVTAVFHFEIPKGRIKKLKPGDFHSQRPDADNCFKTILDSINRVGWSDDCIVAHIEARKVWDVNAFTEVVVEDLV